MLTVVCTTSSSVSEIGVTSEIVSSIKILSFDWTSPTSESAEMELLSPYDELWRGDGVCQG